MTTLYSNGYKQRRSKNAQKKRPLKSGRDVTVFTSKGTNSVTNQVVEGT